MQKSHRETYEIHENTRERAQYLAPGKTHLLVGRANRSDLQSMPFIRVVRMFRGSLRFNCYGQTVRMQKKPLMGANGRRERLKLPVLPIISGH